MTCRSESPEKPEHRAMQHKDVRGKAKIQVMDQTRWHAIVKALRSLDMEPCNTKMLQGKPRSKSWTKPDGMP